MTDTVAAEMILIYVAVLGTVLGILPAIALVRTWYLTERLYTMHNRLDEHGLPVWWTHLPETNQAEFNHDAACEQLDKESENA